MKCQEINRIGTLSYEKCERIVRSSRHGGLTYSVRIGPNTWIRADGVDYLVVLYSTPIIRFSPDGAVILSSGGHQTPTTKDRINALSPARIHQERYVWYVGKLEFYDGLNVGVPRTERESLEYDVMRELAGAKSILADYDLDHTTA